MTNHIPRLKTAATNPTRNIEQQQCFAKEKKFDFNQH